MRDVLRHPFFGIGKLAGVAPVFNRPKLGQISKIVDISAIHPKEKDAETQAHAKSIDSSIKPDESPMNEPTPSPKPTTASRSESEREERKHPASSQPYASIPANPISPSVPVLAAPAPAPASVSRVSKFGIKGIKFGKKK